MADFDKAMRLIFRQEGCYSDKKSDRGSATNYGISLRFLKGLGDAGDIDMDGDIDKQDILALTKNQAERFYRSFFWNKSNLDLVENQTIANMIMSIAVNTGNSRCAKLVQKSINEINKFTVVDVDGIIGAKTISILNDCSNVDFFMSTFALETINFYRHIVKTDRSQYVNLLGWVNRVFELLN